MVRFRVCCLYYSQLVHHPALRGIAIVYPKDKSRAMFDFTVLNPCPKTTASHIPYNVHHPCVHRTWFGTTLRQWYHLRDSVDSQKG